MRTNPASPYSIRYDLTNCDKEPLRFISTVQSHAALLVCSKENLAILQASNNCEEFFAVSLSDIQGKSLSEFLPSSAWEGFQTAIDLGEEFLANNPIRMEFPEARRTRWLNCLVHYQDEFILLEFEPFEASTLDAGFQNRIGSAIQRIQLQGDLNLILENIAQEVKQITGFDRVMLYRFLKDGHGSVVAEAKEPELQAYLGLHYPASDIPEQARALFLKNQVRIISDVQAEPSILHPAFNPTLNHPTNLTKVVSRGVSPVHLEYLSNMGVRSSMSIAIVFEEKLWGLIACHHYSASKFIDFLKRNTVLLFSRIISGHLGLQLAHEFRRSVLESNIMKSKLFEQMTLNWNIFEGLAKGEHTLLDLNNCSGAAIFYEGQLEVLGEAPSKEEIKGLAEWLDDRDIGPLFHTDELSAEYPSALKFKKKAAGLLAVRLAKLPGEYIFWFKPETSLTVSWGGKPDKTVVKTTDGRRLSPRKSFEKWTQEVANTSTPWKQHEIDAALALRSDVKDFIFQKYQEVKQSNQKLTNAYEELESFSYSVSHDLRAPLRNIDSLAHILKEDHGANLNKEGKFLLNAIIGSASKLSNLIDDILEYSKMSSWGLRPTLVPLDGLVREVSDELLNSDKYKNNEIQLIVQPHLPDLYGDRNMLRQLIMNVLSNAFKYSQQSKPPTVEIGGGKESDRVYFFVKDNGIGFDMKFAEKIFGVFTRLVTGEDYAGTGVGMAIVKRIVNRHEGKIEIESELDKGSTFRFIFPAKEMNLT